MAEIARIEAPAALIAVAGLAIIAYAAYELRGAFVGDAAVYLPYARNAANGHPFQFNVGEFSSGSTSPLWSVLLGIPYLLGLGLTGAKAFAAAVAGLGFVSVMFASARLSRSWTAGAVAATFALGTTATFGMALYESGLVVTLASLSLVAADRALGMWRNDGRISRASLIPLLFAWMGLLIARPDAAILVVAQAVALSAFAPLPRRRDVLIPIGAALAVAALPALAYYGYSLIELDTFSTSSQGRSQALREASDTWLGPLYLSGSAIRELFSSPWVFGTVPAITSMALLIRDRGSRWLPAFALLSAAAYLALFTFVTPGLLDTPRYLVPLAPVAAVGIAVLLARARATRVWRPVLLLVAAALGISALQHLRDYVDFSRSIGITDTEVFEKDVGAMVNRLANPGDVLLSYEVQMRLFVRDDVRVLSEDGITDGKVAPYQHSHDMTAFLMRYRPRWWIADRNVGVRRFMRGSVLETVYRRFDADRAARSATVDGIRFDLVARRTRPLAAGFGGWSMLFRLGYPSSGE